VKEGTDIRGLPLTSIGSGTSQADLTTLIDFIFKTSLANWEIALMTSHKHLPISIMSYLFTTRVAEVSSGFHHLWFWSTKNRSPTDPLVLSVCSDGFLYE